MLVKAVANSTTASFIRVVGSEFVQKYLGEVSLGVSAFQILLHVCLRYSLPTCSNRLTGPPNGPRRLPYGS